MYPDGGVIPVHCLLPGGQVVSDGPIDPEGPIGPVGPCGPVPHDGADPDGPCGPAVCTLAAYEAVYPVIAVDEAALADMVVVANEELIPVCGIPNG